MRSSRRPASRCGSYPSRRVVTALEQVEKSSSGGLCRRVAQNCCEVARNLHRLERTDAGAAGVPDRHPDTGKDERSSDPRELRPPLPRIAALPADAKHRHMRPHMRQRISLAEDVGSFEMPEGRIEIARCPPETA